MQIKKINNNKLKVILSSTDLDKKNIDIDTFLANPIESQDLFFEILDLAEEKFNFDINNNKAVIESVSLDNNIFILTITKFKNDYDTYENCSKIYYFNTINELLNLYSFLKKYDIDFSILGIFEFERKYYFILNEKNNLLESFFLEFSNTLDNNDTFEDFLIEYGNKIKI